MVDGNAVDRSPDPSPRSSDAKVHESSQTSRPLLLTVKEAAALLGIGRSTLYRIMERGEIHSVQIGASRRIPMSDALAFVDRLIGSTVVGHEPGADR